MLRASCYCERPNLAIAMLEDSGPKRPVPQPESRERELIRRINSGDVEKFYELIRPYERRVYAAAFAILRNEADAEDVAAGRHSEGICQLAAVSR